MTNRTTPILWILIAAILSAVTFIGYLVTTFLFAFSSGQYRMVWVVNLGAAPVVLATLISAGIAWRLRGATTALIAATATTLGGWFVAAIVEWVVSFFLGATG